MIPMLQCFRVFDAKGKFGDQLSYCIGMELSDATYYIKAESAKIYNEWIVVSCCVASICIAVEGTSLSCICRMVLCV